jgi:ligand-binding SRPBCC domain-containing protein
MPVTLERKSIVSATLDEVWKRVVHPDGINYELAPLMRMTVPRKLNGQTIDDVELGRFVCRSWFLLFGVLPIDYDDIVIAERERGHRFRETSSMFSIRSWEHERTLRAVDGGTEVNDRVTFELRPVFSMVPGMRKLITVVLSRLFDHRHQRLAKWFRARPGRERRTTG